MPPKTRSNNKTKQPSTLDIDSKLDLILNSVADLQSQNDELKSEFDDVQSRLDTVEESRSNNDTLSRKQASLQHTRNGKTLEKDVLRRLKKLNLWSDSSSDTCSDDDEISFKSKSKAERKNLKKSGKLRTAHHKVSRYIDWPHMYVYRRDNASGVKYEALQPAEFMHGYLQAMQNEKNPKTREYMYDHLIDLTADAADYPWPTVRNFHSVVLCMMEAGRLEWSQTQVIQDLRRQYVWTAPMNVKNPSTTSTARTRPS